MVSKSPFLFACALEISAPIEKATLSPDPRGFRIAHIPSPVQFFYQYVAQVLIGLTNKNPEPHIGINVEISEREKSKSQTHKKITKIFSPLALYSSLHPTIIIS